MEETKEHPLKGAKENQKIAYLSIVASIASIDGKVDKEELHNIMTLCEQVDINSNGIGKIIEAAKNPKLIPLKNYFEELKKSELKYTLVADLYFLGYSDNKLTNEEVDEITVICENLNVNNEQKDAIAKYVKAMIVYANDKMKSKETLKEVGSEIAGSLAAAGVPLGAVAVSGSVFGLSAAGMTSGLAALGFGFGMATGIGMVAVIGVASFVGVRWAIKKLTD